MRKTEALAAMGQQSLLLPIRIKAALAANDRLKVYLSVLQSGIVRATEPESAPMNLDIEIKAAGVEAPWLHDLPGSAQLIDGAFVFQECERLMAALAQDLELMSMPLNETGSCDDALRERATRWQAWLTGLRGERLTPEQVARLVSGDRAEGNDSLHLLIMDLHQRINRLASEVSSEIIDGAHVWQLAEEDRSRVAAFMHGLNRTAALKFDHPGLETAATRDGPRLILQNDIGENDVHVLVVHVEETTVTLTYSDLHAQRLDFFKASLAPLGMKWEAVASHTDGSLNAARPYAVATGQIVCPDTAQLDAVLDTIGASLVFLIDWNRARKRLLPFVSKRAAADILLDAARRGFGHMAWLKAGGDALIFGAMQAAGSAVFRIGDRLDTVLGEADAKALLLETMDTACRTLLHGQPAALVADETRLLIGRHVRQHTSEFDLLDEHAGYCHALAQSVSDALMLGTFGTLQAARELSSRAKLWERQADHLVMRAREQAQRQPSWEPFGHLIELSDDIADALEEAAFLMSLIADGHMQGWNHEVHDALSRLADAVLAATQEHVKALAIARSLSANSDASDSDAFLAASWKVLQAERSCDELLRTGRRAILAAINDAPALMLANDLACTLELASDRLLVAGYALRALAFGRTEAKA
ncbi:phosphate transport regulator [Paraburkholderia guartelaensis]|uniref:phosphate transport regulator n=1 Tax=Paraburkholderia guartelaensis TaxID=2546446 RepID=UPI002AB7278C|nr:phosphate transport regulator [Paraburkholderia guartelaensis]